MCVYFFISPVLELYDLENWPRVLFFFSATVYLLSNLKKIEVDSRAKIKSNISIQSNIIKRSKNGFIILSGSQKKGNASVRGSNGKKKKQR